ncbi:ribosome-inactivating family protein [Streptomyces sp. AS02]|uniref:ribosome-inactivating family protein n=1 Tax=Streptomyces sp. AS02 TaxID=2938946 RepID=UPI0020228222|nr:ribosome-inactivating family protein [Streptomyces sp. AS02]MCL8010997.1 ribosome-inactivating family protein [Streptomyces sp. AS02]
MSHTDDTTLPTLPEREAHEQPTAAPRQRTRKVTIGSVVTTLVLSIFATLLGPLGVLSSANAADGHITWKIGDSDPNSPTSYVQVVRAIRNAVNTEDATVPGAGYQVMHTDTTATQTYVDIDVEDAYSDTYVRVRMRASDMYLMGWWANDGQYHYADESQGSSSNSTPAPFKETYLSLEQNAGTTRYDVTYSEWQLSNAVHSLLKASKDNTREQARAFLMLVQALAEGPRFRPIADFFRLASAPDVQESRMPWQLVDMENSWGQLSERFNTQMKNQQSEPSSTAMWIWSFNRKTGEWVKIFLNDPKTFAAYCLLIALGKYVPKNG